MQGTCSTIKRSVYNTDIIFKLEIIKFVIKKNKLNSEQLYRKYM